MINPILPIPVIVIVCLVMAFFLTRKGVWNTIRHIIIVLLLGALLIRPSLPSERVIVVSSNIDILFVVDNTISMVAEDFGSDDRPRLEGVLEHANMIMDSFEGARYSVVTFDSVTNTLVPYTYEKELVSQAISALNGEASAYAQGTSLNNSYDSMRSVFRRSERQGEDESNTEATSNRIQIVFYISDGEITNDNDDLRDFSDLSEYIDGGAVLGYGTSTGGYMQARVNPLDEEASYVEYYNDNWVAVRAVSKIDEDNLEQIADDLGIEYYHMVNKSGINSVIEDIKDQIEEEEYSRNEARGEGFIELYPYIAAGLFIFVAYDCIYYRHKLSKEG